MEPAHLLEGAEGHKDEARDGERYHHILAARIRLEGEGDNDEEDYPRERRSHWSVRDVVRGRLWSLSPYGTSVRGSVRPKRLGV